MKFGQRLIAALEEAVAIAKGEKKPAAVWKKNQNGDWVRLESATDGE